MQLSAELFFQIINGLRSDESMSSRHEKRKEGRVGMRCSVDVTPQLFDDKGPKTASVKVRDISASGIGFISHEGLDIGTILNCRMPREGGDAVQIKMTVRHCIKISKGLYNVGASFEKLGLKATPDKGEHEPAEASAI